MADFALLDDFTCLICRDFGVVEVWVEPPFGERHDAETEWRVCECRRREEHLAQEKR